MSTGIDGRQWVSTGVHQRTTLPITPIVEVIEIVRVLQITLIDACNQVVQILKTSNLNRGAQIHKNQNLPLAKPQTLIKYWQLCFEIVCIHKLTFKLSKNELRYVCLTEPKLFFGTKYFQH